MNRKPYLPSTVTPLKSVLNQLKRILLDKGECFKTLNSQQFGICDPDDVKTKNPCHVQDDLNGITHFTVKNPTERDIHFLAIDHCLFLSDNSSRCDFAVFDDETFCLVEIKTASLGQRRNQRIKAEDQLKESVLFFRDKIEDPEKTIEAYVCLLDKKTFGPCLRTNSPTQVLRFAEMGVALYYGDFKRFA